jgi:HEAT repeat protein
MFRFRSGLSALLLVLFVGGLLAAQPPKPQPAEPTYGGKSLSEWVNVLGNASAAERRRSIVALRSMGGDADALAERLFAGAVDPKARSAAHAMALGELGPPVVPALIRGLWTEDRWTRQVCLFALNRLGADGRAAAPSVIKLLGDPDVDIRRDCIAVLRASSEHRAIPAITGLLRDPDADVRLYAAGALAWLGAPAEEIVPVVAAELRQDDAQRLRLATSIIADLGPEAAAAVPALVKLISRDDAELTIRLARALSAIGPAAKDAIPSLKKRLAEDKHRGHEIGLDIAIALWRIARDHDAPRILREQMANSARPDRVAEVLSRIDSGEETIKALAELLKSEKPEVAIAAAGVLGSKVNEAVPLLGRMLAHTEPNVRARAVVALVRLGPEAKGAIEPLRASTKDDNPEIGFWSTVALCRLDPTPEAIAAVAGYLDHRDPQLRLLAAGVLGQLGAKAASAAPRLAVARTDEDGPVRLAAVMAAWKATSDPTALQSATELLKFPDEEVRSMAALDIGEIMGSNAKPIVPELVKRLFDAFSSVRSNAAESLGRIGPAASSAAPALLALLEGDEPSFVQSAACEALGRIQPNDKEAVVAVLRKKVVHPDPLTRIHAALSLWQLAGDDSGAKEAERGIKYRSHHVRITAAEMLWRMKQDGRVVPFLVRTLEDSNLEGGSNENERYMAARALGRIGSPAKAALPELRKLLSHPDAGLADIAAEAVRAIEADIKK